MKIVAFSDQHGHLDFQLPEADLVLCAGDVCPDFQPGYEKAGWNQAGWLETKWMPWLQKNTQDTPEAWATFGNHDFLKYGSRVFGTDSWIRVSGKTIWLSPWSNEFGGWAWMKSPEDLKELYSFIPNSTDIIVSHQPPYGYGDLLDPKMARLGEDPHVGSKELLDTIDRVKPELVICGHIHSGRGSYQRGETRIYNVAVVNEAYERVHEPVEIDL
jgi:Icc-related predicted phosphoesterase